MAKTFGHSTGACSVFGLVHRFNKVTLGLADPQLEVTCCACGVVRVKTPKSWVHIYTDGTVKQKPRKAKS